MRLAPIVIISLATTTVYARGELDTEVILRHWSTEIQAQIKTEVKRLNRNPETAEKAFPKLHNGAPKIQAILDAYGPPDGFSPYGIWNFTKSTSDRMKTGGTLRFIIDRNTELHVLTPDYNIVTLATMQRRNGKWTLLYK